jgi:hypothetical protein
MSYRIPDKTVKVDPAGSLPTIKFKANLASTHFHIQTKTPNGWVMVVDDQGLGKEVQIKGGPINSAADFAGKRIFWDITLASLDDSNPVEAVLQATIEQDGKLLLQLNDDHQITGMESYYEFIDCQ